MRMKAMAIVNNSASILNTTNQTLPNNCSVPARCGTSKPTGVRRRNSAPYANRKELAGRRAAKWQSLLHQSSAAADQVYAAIIAALKNARIAMESAIAGTWQTMSHRTAPPKRRTIFGFRPPKIQAPAQVTANDVNRIAFAMSIVTALGNCPYIPNIAIDAARSKWAFPHHAVALML